MLLQTQKFTPKVYYQQSRDFQLLGRLFDVVLNSVKANAEMLYSLPLSQNSDERLLQLMSLTMGFKARHDYNNQQLKAFCSVFPYIIKHKGSLAAFEALVNALANAQGLNDSAVNVSIDETKKIVIFQLPKTFRGKTLLRDALTYILPAGMRIDFRVRSQEYITMPITKIKTTALPTSIQISPDTEIDDLAKIIDHNETYTPTNALDGTEMTPINVGNINYGRVIDRLQIYTLQPGVQLDFLQDYVGTGDVVEVEATIKLFNELSQIGFEKKQKTGEPSSDE